MTAREESEIPDEFVCPLTLGLMQDPVMTRYGQSYERDAILDWLSRGNVRCPMTRQPLKLSDIVTNHRLRARIHKWQVDNEGDVTLIMDRGLASLGRNFVAFIDIDKGELDETERSEDDTIPVVERASGNRQGSRRSAQRIPDDRRAQPNSDIQQGRRWGLLGRLQQARRAPAA